MQGEPERCRAAGMDDFVAKPTTIPFLAAGCSAGCRTRLAGDRAPARHRRPRRRPAATCSTPRVLSELTGGDGRSPPRCSTTSSPERARTSARLRARRRSRDLDDVRRQAHRIKGASRMVGAREVRDLASRIEREAGSPEPDWPSMLELLDPLEEALARVAEVAESRRERAR